MFYFCMMAEAIGLDKQDFEIYTERLQNAVGLTMRMIGSKMAEQETSLTGPQFFILKLLSLKGKCTVTELAEEMRVKPSAITAMVDRLHKNGLVLRERDEKDRRVVYIQISDAGSETLEKAQKTRRQIIQRFLSHLEPEELKFFVHIFEKLAQKATSEGREKDHRHQEKE